MANRYFLAVCFLLAIQNVRELSNSLIRAESKFLICFLLLQVNHAFGAPDGTMVLVPKPQQPLPAQNLVTSLIPYSISPSVYDKALEEYQKTHETKENGSDDKTTSAGDQLTDDILEEGDLDNLFELPEPTPVKPIPPTKPVSKPSVPATSSPASAKPTSDNMLFPDMEFQAPPPKYGPMAPIAETKAQIDEILKQTPITTYGKKIVYLVAERNYNVIRASANAEFEMASKKVRTYLDQLRSQADDSFGQSMVADIEKVMNEKLAKRKANMTRLMKTVVNRGMARLTPSKMVTVANFIDALVHKPISESKPTSS